MTDDQKWHDVDDETIDVIESVQLNAFTDGWVAGQIAAGVGADWPMLEHRVNAAEAYNAEHGTDHMGDMLRRIKAREEAPNA